MIERLKDQMLETIKSGADASADDAVTVDLHKKASLGQFMTPPSVATFMAGMFARTDGALCRLLDAGAGRGALSIAFLERAKSGEIGVGAVNVDAFEIDPAALPELDRNLRAAVTDAQDEYQIILGDFIERAVRLCESHARPYSHAIINPPYKKIKSGSAHRLLLSDVGIETVNLYSAFCALTVALMAPGGQVVAILPRSFCNGPYYRPFREFVLSRAAIRRIHLFDARNKAFKDDQVLQENVIVLLERDGVQGDVVISTSTDDRFDDLASHIQPFGRIVFDNDPEKFIHVPTVSGETAIELSHATRFSLTGLNLTVSTGPVVDFRLKDHLRPMPAKECVPLLYPGHFNGISVLWPRTDFKKSNAIERNMKTERWLYPTGHYCVVRRFSSKEERRRIVASIVRPVDFDDYRWIGFENHLNVFHFGRHGLPEDLAYGLVAFLNTTAVDEAFRRFNGHTQVNATDLKAMKYPSRESLVTLGRWLKALNTTPDQQMIDDRFGALAA